MTSQDPERPANHKQDESEAPLPPLPPDGGWGWIIVFASLICNIIVDGVCFSFGIFFLEFLDFYGASKGKTAMAGSLIPGMYLSMGPISSALSNKYGIRKVTIVGTIIAGISFFCSTFAPNIEVLIFTYGVMGGIGFGLMYLPSIVIVNFYFAKRRALATGIAVCGSGVGTFIFTSLAPFLLRTYGWKGSYWIITGIIFNGVVCAAVFRPLEARKPKPPRPAISSDDITIKRGIIMEKIIEEKKRQRTISEHTLDGCIITKNNELIKDKSVIKKLMLQKIEESDRAHEGDGTESTAKIDSKQSNGVVPNGHVNTDASANQSEANSESLARKISAPAAPPGLRNKHLDRVKGNVRSSGPLLFSSITSIGGSRRRTTSNASELWKQGNFESKSKLEQQEFKTEIARPMYRQDIFFTGSVTSLATFQSNRSVKSYVDSTTSIPEPEPEEIGTLAEKCIPFSNILREMLDFSLLRSPTFVPLALTSILAMLGFFTPFVYIVDYCISIGIDRYDASSLLQVLGISNTVGRIVAGFISDQPWADCLLIHNIALIVAGALTCLVPYITSWPLLVIYCVVFGNCIAAFISLRTIVLTDLLGIERLMSSFGLLLLFQGIASLVGTPLTGAIYDATKEYNYSFLIAGVLICLSGMVSLPVRQIQKWEEQREQMMYEDPEAVYKKDDGVGSTENRSRASFSSSVRFGNSRYSRLHKDSELEVPDFPDDIDLQSSEEEEEEEGIEEEEDLEKEEEEQRNDKECTL